MPSSPRESLVRWLFEVLLVPQGRQRPDLQFSGCILHHFDGIKFGFLWFIGLFWENLWINWFSFGIYWANLDDYYGIGNGPSTICQGLPIDDDMVFSGQFTRFFIWIFEVDFHSRYPVSRIWRFRLNGKDRSHALDPDLIFIGQITAVVRSRSSRGFIGFDRSGVFFFGFLKDGNLIFENQVVPFMVLLTNDLFCQIRFYDYGFTRISTKANDGFKIRGSGIFIILEIRFVHLLLVCKHLPCPVLEIISFTEAPSLPSQSWRFAEIPYSVSLDVLETKSRCEVGQKSTSDSAGDLEKPRDDWDRNTQGPIIRRCGIRLLRFFLMFKEILVDKRLMSSHLWIRFMMVKNWEFVKLVLVGFLGFWFVTPRVLLRFGMKLIFFFSFWHLLVYKWRFRGILFQDLGPFWMLLNLQYDFNFAATLNLINTGSRWFWFQFWFGWKRNLDSRYILFRLIGFVIIFCNMVTLEFWVYYYRYAFDIYLVIRIIRFSQGIYVVCSYLENPKSQILKYLIIFHIQSYIFGLRYWVPGNAVLFQRIENAVLSGQQPLRSRVHL